MRGGVFERHLVRTKRAFNLQAVNRFWPGPALGRIEHDHRPARAHRFTGGARLFLCRANLLNGRIQCGGHRLVHQRRLMAFHEQRRPAATAQKLLQLLAGDAREHGGVGDLVAVQVQDRQHRAVGHWVEKLVGVPGRGQRPGFSLAVADHAGNDQLGVVEHRAKGVAERITQLPALVN